jgi:type VI secretion system protein ImpK
MSDNSDKTVFKQPMPGGNRTVLKQPTPGGQRSGQAAPQQAPTRNVSSVELTSFHTGKGLNSLVNLASTLLAVFEKTRQSLSHGDIGGLHQRLIGEIRTFEGRMRDAGIRQEVILSARYLICSVLDESVLNTPWGGESAWSQRTLLSIFHNETSGGEKCFLILDRLRQSPAENIEIIELFYICLSLGFEGKYRLTDRGKDQLDQLREELYAIIRRYRGDYERNLSANWQGLGNVRKSLENYVPLWVVLAFVGAILFFGYSGFRYWLYSSSAPIAAELHNISGSVNEQGSDTDIQ